MARDIYRIEKHDAKLLDLGISERYQEATHVELAIQVDGPQVLLGVSWLRVEHDRSGERRELVANVVLPLLHTETFELIAMLEIAADEARGGTWAGG